MASSDYLLCDGCGCKIVYADHIEGVLCPKCVLSLIDRAEAAEAKMDNLAALVRILVHSLRKVDPNNSNIIRALDYLKRHRLTGSILRSDEPQPKEIPESGGHIESADCWCGPTVEEHPGGTLIIHNQTH